MVTLYYVKRHMCSSYYYNCYSSGVLDTTLCDKVCQSLAAGRWVSPGTPVSSTNKTDSYDKTEILSTVALNTITLTSVIHTTLNKFICCTLALIYI